jgi:hypothetical protein
MYSVTMAHNNVRISRVIEILPGAASYTTLQHPQ